MKFPQHLSGFDHDPTRVGVPKKKKKKLVKHKTSQQECFGQNTQPHHYVTRQINIFIVPEYSWIKPKKSTCKENFLMAL